MNKTAIFLTNNEANLFKKFREYQDDWEKVFHIRGGSVKILFDDSGQLRYFEYKFKEKPRGLTKLV
jgi:hypothetical protein